MKEISAFRHSIATLNDKVWYAFVSSQFKHKFLAFLACVCTRSGHVVETFFTFFFLKMVQGKSDCIGVSMELNDQVFSEFVGFRVLYGLH